MMHGSDQHCHRQYRRLIRRQGGEDDVILKPAETGSQRSCTNFAAKGRETSSPWRSTATSSTITAFRSRHGQSWTGREGASDVRGNAADVRLVILRQQLGVEF